jgi:hypothetical protein
VRSRVKISLGFRRHEVEVMRIKQGASYASVTWAAVLLGACSNKGTTTREAGLQGAPAMAGSGAVGAAAAVPLPVNAPVSAATPEAAPVAPENPALTRGDRLEFLPGIGDLPYVLAPNAYGLAGSGFLSRSALGTSITVGADAGKICVQGSLASVPNGDYGEYWGVELGFNLTQLDAAASDALPNTGAAPSTAREAAADAGKDASVDAALVNADASSAAPSTPAASAWSPGKVIGFSFVIEGPTIDIIRFKALPDGYDRSLEASVFCKQLTPPSGAVNDALFADMTQYCWDAPPQAQIPLDKGLDNISWQLPADVTGPRAFDWCLTELRPILTQ